jgi:hypothetical protein
MLDEQHVWTWYDWAPIGTLVLTMVSVCLLLALGRWVWRTVTAPPPPMEYPPIIIPTVVDPPAPTRPMPAAVHDQPATYTATVVHKALVAAVGEETAEWRVVWTDDGDEQVLAFDGALAPEDTTPLPALIEDELGAWDPDTVDWLEPATYLETVHICIRLGVVTLHEETQERLTASFKDQTMAALHGQLTGG